MSVDYPIVIAIRDEGVRQELETSFLSMGFECRCTGDAEGALGLLRSQGPWLVVTELGLSRDEALLETIKEEPTTACVAIVTGAVSGKEVARIVKAGATEVFEYPRDRGDLLRFVDNLGLSTEGEEDVEFLIACRDNAPEAFEVRLQGDLEVDPLADARGPLFQELDLGVS